MSQKDIKQKSTSNKARTEQIDIFINDSGQIEFIYDDYLIEIIKPHIDSLKKIIKRASFVEPDLKGNWYIDFSPIKDYLKENNLPVIVGPFETRAEALNQEKIILIRLMKENSTSHINTRH